MGFMGSPRPGLLVILLALHLVSFTVLLDFVKMAMGQNSSALTNTKIDGKWMFILRKKNI
jgi:hypothetical protein